MVYLTRKVEFCASHRYYIDEKSEEENLKLFGKCSYPHGHGHNYILEVTVKGDVNPQTGMVMNLTDIDRILKDIVVEMMDHKFLNLDIPEFKDKIPTTENLVLYIWDSLVNEIKECSLHRVRLHEDPFLYAEYHGE